jgi:uncharacterized RDD family membrane protein YckC
LTIRRDTRAVTPLDDLPLIDDAAAEMPRLTSTGADLDRLLGVPDEAPDPWAVQPIAPEPARSRSSAAARSAAASAELPLFISSISDDEPLITRASPPRAPLAVRRATPDVPRVRGAAPRAAAFDLVLEDAPSASNLSPAERAAGRSWDDASDATPDAGVPARLVAAVIDLLILAAIDVVVVYFTLQICGITIADLDVLPKGPLIAFLFVQNGGYLVAFTAGGQTLGKMAAGIRVVPADSEARLDLGRAFLRTLMWVLLAVPAGLGFLTAVFSRDRRGLHDRFAGTRVVRASA